MKVFLKDGTMIKIIENEIGDAKVNFGVEGYILITGSSGSESFARIMMPKDSVNFIDLENNGETGLIIEAFPPMNL